MRNSEENWDLLFGVRHSQKHLHRSGALPRRPLGVTDNADANLSGNLCQRQLVEPMIPRKEARTGRPPMDRRVMLNGILWVLATGAAWRDLPERFGPWQTVYDYFANWRRDGVFAGVMEALQIKLDEEGLKFDKQMYRGQCVVEQCVGWLKENRRIGTRFENAGDQLPGDASTGDDQAVHEVNVFRQA